MKKREADLEKLVEALGDEPVDDEAARAEVARLKIDVGQMAGALRAKIAAADRKAKFDDAQRGYAEEVERLERRKIETKPTRDEQLVVFRALLKRAPAGALVGMHFHKYESATDAELAELVKALRHLLGDDDG